jgi:nitrogen fixation protein NifZ
MHHPGDLVYAAIDLYNDAVEGEDGGIHPAIPGQAIGALLVPGGSRGVIVQIGETQEPPHTTIYLVRFEREKGGELGEPIGCLAEELQFE